VQEIFEVPTRQIVDATPVIIVVLPEQLFAHHSENEDDDSKHHAQVAECAHRPANYTDQQVQRRPRLGQLEHP